MYCNDANGSICRYNRGGTEGGTQVAPTETVRIDVSGENTENADYKITDTSINLSKGDVQYELTGTTDKKIQIWGSNSPDPVKTFYLRLNNTTVNGGIDIYNPNGAKLVIEVAEGTTNFVKNVYAVDLTITGKGTLNSKDLGVTQQSSSDTRLSSSLYIKDTTIKVEENGNPSQWNGECVLDGDANITYDNVNDYASLSLGQTFNFKHYLTMKGNSKLYCLHTNADTPSDSAVDGLAGFNGSIKLQDNSYLEAQGRAGSGQYIGSGVVCDGNILIEDNATMKAIAYGTAISTWGNINASGGTLIAKSSGEKCNGVYAPYGTISISNANAEITGDYPALYSNGNVLIENSLLKATSTGDVAIYSSAGDITLKNSFIEANGADGCYGIYSNNGVKASGSWLETTGTETLDNTPDSIESSVLFNGTAGKVIGNHSINKDVTVSDGMILDIPEGTSITVPEGKTLTNNGIIEENGTFERIGTIVNNGIIIKPAKIFNFGEAKSGYSAVDPQVLLEKGDGGYDVSITDNDYELVTDSGNVMICPKTGLAAGEYNKKLEIKITNNGTDVMSFECGVNFKVTAASSGGSYNPVQKPEIITGEGGKTSLENNGTTLVIIPDDGMQISKVTVNGNEVTVNDNKVTGLKTGDKVEVTFTKIPPTKEEIDKAFKEKLLNLGLTVRTSKTAQKNVKAVVKETSESNDLIKEIKDAGYTVKYKFYRSTKKSSKYEAKITKTEGNYINTIGKKGTKYYYKVKLQIYDTEGKPVGQTELKQCKYGLRIWSK